MLLSLSYFEAQIVLNMFLFLARFFLKCEQKQHEIYILNITIFVILLILFVHCSYKSCSYEKTTKQKRAKVNIEGHRRSSKIKSKSNKV